MTYPASRPRNGAKRSEAVRAALSREAGRKGMQDGCNLSTQKWGSSITPHFRHDTELAC